MPSTTEQPAEARSERTARLKAEHAAPEVDVVLPRADVEELQRMVAAYDALMDDDTISAEQYAHQAAEQAAALVGYLGAALGHARAGGR